jgi:ssDNA thymidine ADP-ribosyltransferase DarT-like protein
VTSPSENARDRGIDEVLHFTTDPGLLGTIRKGELLSRERVQDDPDLAFIFQPIWPPKALEWIDYISLSLGRINRTLYDRAVSNLKERWWGVLAFNLEILDHDDVWFATTNNAYETVCRRAQGVAGFDALFGPRIPWGHYGSVCERPGDAPRNRTTDPQAEVLYPGAIPLDHLKAVYVGDAQHRDLVVAWCDVLGRTPPAVEVRPERFV